MAHNLTVRADGTAEFAFTGSRDNIWHGLGAELDQNSTIEQWKTAAGMDWEIFESKISYQSITGSHIFDGKRALFRSDNKEGLSIVSDDYKVVQPGEILEFFRDLVALHDMKLSTAGTLFGGKRFWALADMGKDFTAVDGDRIDGRLLLVTSADGSLATQARFVSERVVCNNTMTIALAENSKHLVKKSHRSVWDPTAVKIDLGLIDSSWNNYMTNIREMAKVKIEDEQVRKYFQSKFYNPEVSVDDQGWGAIKKVNRLIELYNTGAGAEYSKGTLYGVLNAVTDLYTHGSGKRDSSHQLWDSQFGAGDNIKTEVYNDMMSLMVTA